MTDIAAPLPAAARRHNFTSPAAQARVRSRYRTEARFKAYGLIALSITTVFLVVLLTDVIRRGIPAFFEHSLVIDVPLKTEDIAPGGKRDPASLRQVDYFPVLRDALKAAIPGIESRGGERTLTRLASGAASDTIRAHVLSNPDAIGTTVKLPLLLSATSDLYYKKPSTAVTSRPGRGIATPSGTTGEITILTSANDFATDLVVVKRVLAEHARRIGLEADRLERLRDPGQAERIKQLREEVAGLRARFDAPKIEEPLDDKVPSKLVAINGGLVKITKLGDIGITGEVMLPLKSTAEAKGGDWRIVTYETPEGNRKATDQEVAFLERFREIGAVQNGFAWRFFTSGDSREPEQAGIRGAIVGTALTLLVTLLLCLPVGVLAAIYLEEFAPKNRLTDLIEVNINNLAAVPSIVFGLLGLAVFLNFFELRRSAPLVGGLVLALLVLPTIIIAARAALKAVPPSIKEAALGVGASHQQAIFHHVLPLAMPGIMTGTIIGMAHALGETAPLLMIGMVAFIVDVPKGFLDAATVLPVQIYLWSDLPEVAFQAKTAAAIIVLLMFLFVMNGLAIWLRKRFERRW